MPPPNAASTQGVSSSTRNLNDSYQPILPAHHYPLTPNASLGHGERSSHEADASLSSPRGYSCDEKCPGSLCSYVRLPVFKTKKIYKADFMFHDPCDTCYFSEHKQRDSGVSSVMTTKGCAFCELIAKTIGSYLEFPARMARSDRPRPRQSYN